MESDNANGFDYFFLNDINTKGGSPFYDDYYCGQFIYYDKYSKNYKWANTIYVLVSSFNLGTIEKRYGVDLSYTKKVVSNNKNFTMAWLKIDYSTTKGISRIYLFDKENFKSIMCYEDKKDFERISGMYYDNIFKMIYTYYDL